MGRLIRAVADDREAAQLSGANYRHVFGIAAAIAFATVAMAGIAYGMMTQFAPTSGGVNLLFAFEAVVIGGIGSLWGTLVGGIALGVAQQFGAHINPQYQVLAGNVLFLLGPGGPAPGSVREARRHSHEREPGPRHPGPTRACRVRRSMHSPVYTLVGFPVFIAAAHRRAVDRSRRVRDDDDELLHPGHHGDDVESPRRLRGHGLDRPAGLRRPGRLRDALLRAARA